MSSVATPGPVHPDRLADVPLTHPIADRAAVRRSPELLAELVADPATRVIEVAGDRLRTPSPSAACSALVRRPAEPQDGGRLAAFLGVDEAGVAQLAVSVDGVADGDPGWAGLRALVPQLGPEQAGIAAQAVAVLNWHATHRFCPRCGTPTQVTHAGWGRHCPTDGADHWPRTDPAVIMTVVDDDDRLLLGRHAGWPQARFSTLAGFVEPGESLETAVRREVLEEVGVRIGRVDYLGSQPWPFPGSIMLGFQAHALTRDAHPDGVEIAEARWFTRQELQQQVLDGVVGLSARMSIARSLVEHWHGSRLREPADSA